MIDKKLHGLISHDAKKISINLDESTLMMIDEMAKILKTTRTMVINGLIGFGMKKCIKSLREEGSRMIKEKKKDPKKINQIFDSLSQFEKKWHMDKFP